VNQNLRGILFCGCLEKAGIADDYCPGLKMQGVILKSFDDDLRPDPCRVSHG
jgi:hypothetical protein